MQPTPLQNIPSFLLEFRRALGFGLLATFLSGFGQTFFVSLFLPSASARLGLTEGDFGHVYAVATLVSGLLLMRAGRLTDRVGERAMFPAACLLVVAGLLLLAWSPWVPVVFVSLFCLRFGGQGVLSLIASSAMARSFVRRRGVALSVSSLGFPASEVILPALTLALLARFGWQATLVWFAVLLLVLLVMPGWFLIRRPLRGDVPPDPGEGRPRSVRPFIWWREPFFVIVTLAATSTLALSGTALFLYQFPLGADRGWSAAWVATCFTACAVTRAVLSLVAGPLIDRFTGTRMVPWTLCPAALAFGLLWLGTNPWLGLVSYVLIGISYGTGPAIMAMMAEQYGRGVVGQLRGSMSAFGVISTAVGAFFAGYVLNLGFSYTNLLSLLAALSVAACAVCFAAMRIAPNRHPA